MLHATDVNNFSLIDAVSQSKFEDVYVGVGGASIDEIGLLLEKLKAQRIILMLGFQAYPTEVQDRCIWTESFRTGKRLHQIKG